MLINIIYSIEWRFPNLRIFDNPNARKVMAKFFEIFAFLVKIGTFPIILANPGPKMAEKR